jgi:hypothetical protein
MLPVNHSGHLKQSGNTAVDITVSHVGAPVTVSVINHFAASDLIAANGSPLSRRKVVQARVVLAKNGTLNRAISGA